MSSSRNTASINLPIDDSYASFTVYQFDRSSNRSLGFQPSKNPRNSGNVPHDQESACTSSNSIHPSTPPTPPLPLPHLKDQEIFKIKKNEKQVPHLADPQLEIVIASPELGTVPTTPVNDHSVDRSPSVQTLTETKQPSCWSRATGFERSMSEINPHWDQDALSPPSNPPMEGNMPRRSVIL